MSERLQPYSPSPSPPSSPRGGESPRSPVLIALGDTHDLTSHDQLANLRFRDRAIAEAARLNALIALFGSLPEGKGYASRNEREAQCEEWQATSEKITKAAVILTLEAQGLGRDMQQFVEKEVRREIAEAPLPEDLEDRLNAFRQYNAAALRPTLEFIHEQPNTTAQRNRQRVEAAVNDKQYHIIEELVGEGALDPNTIAVEDDDDEKLSLLAYGIKHDLSDEFLKTLIEAKADLSVVVGRGEEAQTIVGVAIKRGWETKLVQHLLDNGAPIPRLIDGISPLAVAYEKRRYDQFQLLLTRDVATNAVIGGKTLLGKILSEDKELSKIIVFGEVYQRSPDGTRHKAFDLISKFDLDARGRNGQTALHDYCESSLFDRRTFQRLLECGGDPGARNANGKTVVEVIILHQESRFLK
jgi:hypothetical protein